MKTLIRNLLFILFLQYISVACERSNNTVSVPAHPPNIILVLVDTLRADSLGCYGYDRDTSPFLDSFAGRGLVFKNAYSNSSHTRLSIASLFTGMLPPQSGVRVGKATKHGFKAHRLEERHTTLAEI
ncbi:MAG: sulfatase-like hydrolase/transferase, partial [Deltaproteobacteria bacterium]|nr:sulfatase-like hydrolase/transferase [Deltaproteobacteria bacterium]